MRKVYYTLGWHTPSAQPMRLRLHTTGRKAAVPVPAPEKEFVPAPVLERKKLTVVGFR